jgi:hypothetical protein
VSDSYFDSAFFKSAGKFFNWLDKTDRKYDLSNLGSEEFQQTYQQLPQDPSSPRKAIPRTALSMGKAALRTPVLGPVLTKFGEGGANALESVYFVWQNAIERPLSTSLTLYGMARDDGGALGPAAAATPFPLNIPLGAATQIGKLPETWKQTGGFGPATISPGRAIGYATTRDAAGLIEAAQAVGVPKAIINPITEAAPVLNPNFMPLDPKWQREAFTDSWLGSLVTGLTDAVFEVAVGGKGGSWLGRKFWNITGRTRVPNTPETIRAMDQDGLNALKLWNETKRVVETVDDAGNVSITEVAGPGWRPKSGIAVDLDELMKVGDDVTRIEAIPMVQRMGTEEQVRRVATNVASAKTLEEKFLVLSTEYGSPYAFKALEVAAPSIADAIQLTNRADKFLPLTPDDVLNTEKLIPPSQVQKWSNILEDMAKRDPEVAENLLELATGGFTPGLTSWAPSRWAFIEKGTLAASRFKNEARFWDTTYADKDLLINKPGFRPIRILAMKSFGDQPLYSVAIRGGRKMQDYYEIPAVLTKASTFKDPEMNPLVRKWAQEYIKVGSDETLRQETLMRIQKEAARTIAQKEAPHLSPNDQARLVDGLIEKQQATFARAVENPTDKNGFTFLAEDADGKIIALDPMVKASLAENFTFLDFGLLERSIKRAVKTKTFDAAGVRILPTGTEIFEQINQAFSASVLIRPGYTPKNAMIEPSFRNFGFNGDLFDYLGMFKGLTRFAQNSSNYAERARIRVSELATGSQRYGVFKERIKDLQSESEVLSTYLKKIEKEVKKRTKELDNSRLTQRGFYVEALENAKDIERSIKTAIGELQENISAISGTLPGTRLAVLRSEVKRSATDEIDIFGTKIPGAFDPTYSGSAWLSNIAPVATIFNTTIQGGLSRFRAAQAAKAKIRPGNTPSYTNAYARTVSQMTNDKSIQMILAGAEPDEVMEYLYNNYKKFGRDSELARIAVEGRLKKGDLSRLDDFINDNDYVREVYGAQRRLVDQMLPDEGIRQRVLAQGGLTADEVAERFGAQFEKGVFPDGKRMPALYGTDYTDNLIYSGKLSRLNTAWTSITRAGFQFLSSPEYYWWRIPFYEKAFKEAMERMYKVAESQGRNATELLTNPKWRASAHQYAIKQVDDTFYSITRMNNFQYASRFVSAFPLPVMNSAKFWAKASLNNPYNLIMLDRMRLAPFSYGESIGQFVVDEEGNRIKAKDAFSSEKELYLLLPNSSKDNEYPAYVGKVPVAQFNYLVDGPSANFVIKFPISVLYMSFPKIEKKIQEALGEDLYSNLLYQGRPITEYVAESGDGFLNMLGSSFFSAAEETVLPRWGKDLVRFTLMGIRNITNGNLDEEIKEYQTVATQTSMFMNIYNTNRVNWIRGGQVGPEPTAKQALEQTQRHVIGATLRRFWSFIGITETPQEMLMREEFQRINEYYETNPDQVPNGMTARSRAYSEFLNLYGEEADRYLSAKKSKGSIDPSQKALEKWSASSQVVNEILAGDSEAIYLTTMFTDPLTNEDYSPAARSYFNTLILAGQPIGGKMLTPQQRDERYEAMRGRFEYNNAILKVQSFLANTPYKTLEVNSLEGLRNELEREQERIFEAYPAYKRESEQGGDNNFSKARGAIGKALNNKKFMDWVKTQPEEESLWTTLRYWYEDNQELEQLLKDNPRMTDYEKSIYKARYQNNIYEYITGNPYFADFFGQWLYGDRNYDKAYMAQRQLGKPEIRVGTQPSLPKTDSRPPIPLPLSVP